MTPEEVRERYVKIVDIDQHRKDWEQGHVDEDNLMVDVLKAISDGVDDPRGLAVAFLEAHDAHWQNDQFDRWYA